MFATCTEDKDSMRVYLSFIYFNSKNCQFLFISIQEKNLLIKIKKAGCGLTDEKDRDRIGAHA